MEEIADPRNITLEMEVLNNFEGYILNSAEEDVKFVKKVNKETDSGSQ